MKAPTLQFISKKYRIKLLILFGSRARKEHRLTSDRDIAFLSAEPLNFKTRLKLMGDLETHFRDTIDLVDLRDANPLLLGCIAKDAQKLYGRRDLFFQELVNAQKQYLDFEPYFKLEEKTIRSQIRTLKPASYAQKS